MFLKLLPFFGQKWPIDGGASFLALFFQEISRKGARFGKILENTKKVAGGRGGVKGATGAAELAVRRGCEGLS